MDYYVQVEDILAGGAASLRDVHWLEVGYSRQGRLIRGARFGDGPRGISLIAGNHADEPTGPAFLRRLCGWLASLPAGHPLLQDYSWWIIPHTNPDGELVNEVWFDETAHTVDIITYLQRVQREKPGDDMEFGYPRDTHDHDARPENRAAWAWWQSATTPFVLHASLHSMSIAGGPWFLIDAAWVDRVDPLMTACREATTGLGYGLHDWERHGEKGFTRIAPGFCTRPSSTAMRDYFLSRNDQKTADRFRPSSMEIIRDLGDDCLTMVSEMPIFCVPGIGKTLGPPDPVWEDWRARMGGWKLAAMDPDPDNLTALRRDIAQSGLTPMPILDQMRLQWRMITAGLLAIQP